MSYPDHPKCGTPTTRHIYRNAEGKPVLIANRYEAGMRGKFFLPLDLETGDWKAPAARPLYNLDLLTRGDRAKPVIFVEGEKCADALTALGYLATTTFGGARASAKTDLAPLAGREVILWPDDDAPGRDYASEVLERLAKLPNTRARFIEFAKDTDDGDLDNSPKSSKIKGWDAADAIAEGWGRAELDKLFLPKTPDVNSPTSSDNLDLWHTPDKEAFASIRRGNRLETMALDSSDFRNYLAFSHYQAEGKMLSQTALEDRRRTLLGEALFLGPERRVYTRIASEAGRIHLDLGNAAWQAVTVTRHGWEITNLAPVRFQRSRAMEALPTPEGDGASLDLLRPFLNVGSEEDFRLLIAWLLGCFHPKGPYPILILTGEQGSAKSTTAKVLRALIDPANPMARSAPQSEQDLVIAAKHNHVLAFDNLSHIKPSMADALCRIATGGGFGTRKLHTNTEEVLFTATRPCLLNGIPDLASRPDLADRAIIVTLPVISETGRKFEHEFWKAFETAAPKILGALLNATSTAMDRLASVTMTERPRMADFARWITAAEPALGWEAGSFAPIYLTNRTSAETAAIEGNPVAEAVLTMMQDQTAWRGTATDLLKALRQRFPMLTEDSDLPRQPNHLTTHLRRVSPLLRRRGLRLGFDREGKLGLRVITLDQLK